MYSRHPYPPNLHSRSKIAAKPLSTRTLPNNQNAAQRIWDAASCGQEGDSHHAIRYTECETDHCDHPDHEVRQYTQPNDRHDECHGIPDEPSSVSYVRHLWLRSNVLPGIPTIRNGEMIEYLNRCKDNPFGKADGIVVMVGNHFPIVIIGLRC